MEQEPAFHAKQAYYNHFMEADILVFSKDNTLATFQYHTYITLYM